MPEAFLLVSVIGNSSSSTADVAASLGVASIQTTLSGTRDEIIKTINESRDQPRESIPVQAALPKTG
jgi:hypothetical protein